MILKSCKIIIILAIYELSTKLDFNCQYRIYNLKSTPLCLDYWYEISRFYKIKNFIIIQIQIKNEKGLMHQIQMIQY
jgi:hypothetical protein